VQLLSANAPFIAPTVDILCDFCYPSGGIFAIWEISLARISELVSANPRVVKQFLKFAIVGAIGTCVDVVTLVFLKEVIGLDVYVANFFSFSLAVINNYTWNSRWTFGDQEKEHKRQIVQFVIISVVGLTLSEILLYFFHDIVHLHYLVGKCLGILIVLFWNFFANRFWTFKE
jgi:putative flippase GtrA